MQHANPLLLAQIISLLAQTNSIYYLHPSFGYYFELFYPEPHGLVYKLNPYPTNALFAPPLGKDLIAENEAFWAEADEQALQPLLAVVTPPNPDQALGLWDRLAKRAHLTREANRDATTLAGFYSRALDYWGVEMQKSGRLTNAAAHFERALELNPDNLVAQVNLECNKNLRAGIQESSRRFPNPSKMNLANTGTGTRWSAQTGRSTNRISVTRRAGRWRATVFTAKRRPSLTARRRWPPKTSSPACGLPSYMSSSQKPSEALKLVEPIHVQPGLLAAVGTNLTELLFVETSAHLAQGDIGGAEATVRATIEQYPVRMRIYWLPRLRRI